MKAMGVDAKAPDKKPADANKATMPTPPPNPTAMEITSDWFKNHPDGAEGLKKLDQIQKEAEKTAKLNAALTQPVPAQTAPSAPSLPKP
jgi:hypothetical protein